METSPRWLRPLQIVAMALVAVDHFALAVLYLGFREPVPAGINAIATAVNVFSLVLVLRTRFSTAAMLVSGAEVVVHLPLLTALVGLPAGYLFGSFALSGTMFLVFPWERRRYGGAIILCAALSAAVTLALLRGSTSLLSVDPRLIEILFWWNGAAFFILLAAIAAFAAGRINSAEHALQQERLRSELLLKQEISHQVAERSRSLGEALAKVDVMLPSERLDPGRVFAERYRLVRPLGRGGMGEVYEVERLTDHERLALKVITGQVSGAQAARFAREAEIGARLRHPNLVSIVDVGVSLSGSPFLVMELVGGGGLDGSRARFGVRPWASAVLRQIAAGLSKLHEAGVVHRDLKPANVLLSGDAKAPLARISDFGISRLGISGGDADGLADTAEMLPGLKGPSLTRAGALMGTPLYMAPEAAKGAQAVHAPADVFAFGLIAFELMTGRLPFNEPVVLEMMAGRSFVPPAALDGPLADLVRACLTQSPDERPTARAICDALG